MENLNVSFNTIKEVLLQIPSYYIEHASSEYDIFSIAENEIISCHIDSTDSTYIDDFENNYKSQCTSVPSIDDAIILGKIANNIPFIIPKSPDGIPLTITQPRTGDEIIISTHNFCDKSSWFSNSQRVDNQSLNSNDGYIWESPDGYWVDMISGRAHDDDTWVNIQKELNPGDPHGYQVIVTVDGYEKEMRTPFFNSGGDYEVYWEDGYIKSFDDWSGKTVTASYSKMVDSIFIIKPMPGKIINIEAAEADFSQDAVMNDTLVYSIYGYAAIFAPQLNLPEGTKIELYTKKYKRLSQVVNEAIGAYPLNEVLASDPNDYNLGIKDFRRKSRGMRNKTQSIPFRYATVRTLKSSLGLELRVKLLNDNAFDGDLSSCTFYCTFEDE